MTTDAIELRLTLMGVLHGICVVWIPPTIHPIRPDASSVGKMKIDVTSITRVPVWKQLIYIGSTFWLCSLVGILLHAKDPFVFWTASFGIMCFIGSAGAILLELVVE